MLHLACKSQQFVRPGVCVGIKVTRNRGGCEIKVTRNRGGCQIKVTRNRGGCQIKVTRNRGGRQIKVTRNRGGCQIKTSQNRAGGKSFRGPNWILSARFGPKRESVWGLYGVCARFVAHVGSSIGTLVLQGGWDFNIFPPTQILDDFKNLQCYLGSGHIALQFPQ